MFPTMGIAAVTTLGGAVTGMYVGDAMQSIPTTANVPATGSAAVPKVTGDGTPVVATVSAKQSLWMSAAIVIAALAILVLGSRYFKDARIG